MKNIIAFIRNIVNIVESFIFENGSFSRTNILKIFIPLFCLFVGGLIVICALKVKKNIKNRAAYKSYKKQVVSKMQLENQFLTERLGPNWKEWDHGKKGELVCAFNLQYEMPDIRVFSNVYLYDRQNLNQINECDVVAVTKKTIYVIEVKNYEGNMTLANEEYVLYIKNNGDREYRRSPVVQNEKHVKQLKKFAHNEVADIPVYNVVSFAFGYTIETGAAFPPNTVICGTRDIPEKIREIEKTLSEKNTNKICEYLRMHTKENVPQNVVSRHLKNAKESKSF